jgi:hypothetical protein
MKKPFCILRLQARHQTRNGVKVPQAGILPEHGRDVEPIQEICEPHGLPGWDKLVVTTVYDQHLIWEAVDFDNVACREEDMA